MTSEDTTLDESDIIPTSWYVISLLPKLDKLRINFSRNLGNLRWNKNKYVKKETKPFCDTDVDKIEVCVKTRGSEISWEGLEPRKGEDYALIKAQSKPRQRVTIVIAIGIDGRDTKGNKEAPWVKKNQGK